MSKETGGGFESVGGFLCSYKSEGEVLSSRAAQKCPMKMEEVNLESRFCCGCWES